MMGHISGTFEILAMWNAADVFNDILIDKSYLNFQIALICQSGKTQSDNSQKEFSYKKNKTNKES